MAFVPKVEQRLFLCLIANLEPMRGTAHDPCVVRRMTHAWYGA